MVTGISSTYPRIGALTNISPFTFRDGTNYLEQLEKMRVFLNDDVVDGFNDRLTQIIEEFNAGLGGWRQAFDQFMVDVEAHLAALNDEAFAGLMEDINSLAGGQLIKNYVNAAIAVGPGIDPTGATDSTVAFQALIDSSRPIVVPPGIYLLDGLNIPALTNITGQGGTSRFRLGTETNPRVIFRHLPSSTKPLLSIDGGGITIEDVEIQGNTNPNPGIHIQDGFELALNRVRVRDIPGTGISIRRVNNTRWYDVMIDNCGTLATAAMVIKSPTFAEGGETNTFDAYGLTIERSQNVALDIGYGGEMSNGFYAEFIRFHNLHVEAPGDNGGLANVDSLIRIGNVRSVVFNTPFIYGGSGPLIEHQVFGAPMTHPGRNGVTVIGGSLLGDAQSTTPHIIRLVSGDDFGMVGTRVHRFTTSVFDIRSTYGDNVRVDPTCVMDAVGTNDQWFTDSRTIVETPFTWIGGMLTNTFSIFGKAGKIRALSFRTDNALRWQFRANETAETGADAGTDLEVRSYKDNGTFSVPVSINRASGAVNVGQMLRIPRMVTTARPAPGPTNAGAHYFDTTLNKPVWSNGFNWVDSAGANT